MILSCPTITNFFGEVLIIQFFVASNDCFIQCQSSTHLTFGIKGFKHIVQSFIYSCSEKQTSTNISGGINRMVKKVPFWSYYTWGLVSFKNIFSHSLDLNNFQLQRVELGRRPSLKIIFSFSKPQKVGMAWKLLFCIRITPIFANCVCDWAKKERDLLFRPKI